MEKMFGEKFILQFQYESIGINKLHRNDKVHENAAVIETYRDSSAWTKCGEKNKKNDEEG